MSAGITGRDASSEAINPVLTEIGGLRIVNYVWDTVTLAWVKQTSGGGGGPSSDVNVLNFPAVQPVSDNGGSITVDGAFFQVTQPVSLVSLPAIAAGSDNIGDVDVATLPTAGGKTITYVPVAQGAAGTTLLAAADVSKKHKIVGCVLTMSAAGTLKFLDSSGDLTGAMDVAASGGFVLPTSMFPYTETGAINRSISITTTAGLAKGVVAILTEA